MFTKTGNLGKKKEILFSGSVHKDCFYLHLLAQFLVVLQLSLMFKGFGSPGLGRGGPVLPLTVGAHPFTQLLVLLKSRSGTKYIFCDTEF